MRQASLLLIALISLISFAAHRPPEQSSPTPAPATAASPALSIQGVGLEQTQLSATDFAALPRRTITVTDKDEPEVKYEGVAMQDLLEKAGMKFGHSMRGPRLRDYLLAESADGYAVIFALPEISEEFAKGTILIADRINGQPISGRDGPLRIIATQDKKHARWVRNVTSLSIHSSSTPPVK